MVTGLRDDMAAIFVWRFVARGRLVLDDSAPDGSLDTLEWLRPAVVMLSEGFAS